MVPDRNLPIDSARRRIGFAEEMAGKIEQLLRARDIDMERLERHHREERRRGPRSRAFAIRGNLDATGTRSRASPQIWLGRRASTPLASSSRHRGLDRRSAAEPRTRLPGPRVSLCPVSTDSGRAATMSSDGLAVASSTLIEQPLRLRPRARSRSFLRRAPPVRRGGSQEVPLAAQLLAGERKVDVPFFSHRRDLAGRHGVELPAIPDQRFAGAVLAIGNPPLEVSVGERVVLGLHREPLDRRVVSRARAAPPTRRARRRSPGADRSGGAARGACGP